MHYRNPPCQNCLQMPSCAKSACRCHREPPNMKKALGWMQSSSWCTKAWCAGGKQQQCPLGQSPGRGETLEMPLCISESVRKAVWWHSKGCLGTEERAVLCGLTRRRQSQPGRSQNSDPASQTAKPLNLLSLEGLPLASNAHMLVWEFFYSPTF